MLASFATFGPELGQHLPMPLDHLIDRAMLLAHRLAGFAAVYLLDDPAMLALMFCLRLPGLAPPLKQGLPRVAYASDNFRVATRPADFVDTQPMHGNVDFGCRPSRKVPRQSKLISLPTLRTIKLTLLGFALAGSFLYLIRH